MTYWTLKAEMAGSKAQVTPKNDTVAFADDGTNYGEGCRVWPWTIADVAAPA